MKQGKNTTNIGSIQRQITAEHWTNAALKNSEYGNKSGLKYKRTLDQNQSWIINQVRATTPEIRTEGLTTKPVSYNQNTSHTHVTHLVV